jgi:hypothetical protein
MKISNWQDEIERLWATLVPQSGQAATVQGELVRCISKLNDECFRNGNCNWDDGHEALCKYLRKWLNDDATFTEAERLKINSAIDKMLDFENPDTSGTGSCGYTIAEKVVAWCTKNSTPIAHVKNPDLKR